MRWYADRGAHRLTAEMITVLWEETDKAVEFAVVRFLQPC
jgi:hypothetical protein